MNRKKRDERRLKALELLRDLEQEYADLEGISVNDERLLEVRDLLCNELDEVELPEDDKNWFLTPNRNSVTCPRVIHIINRHCVTAQEKSYLLYREIVDSKLDAQEALKKLGFHPNTKRLLYTWGYSTMYSIDFHGQILWSTGVKNFADMIRNKGYKISQGNVGRYDLQKHIYVSEVELDRGE